MKLHLGVSDVAYSDPDTKDVTTTAEVAMMIEAEYHVMRVFYETHKAKVEGLAVDALKDRIDAIFAGNAAPLAVRSIDFDSIRKDFNDYLDRDEWQKITGRVIMAAKMGVSHRKKDKKRSGPRPAFIDTGLYQQSMRVWMDDK